VSNFYSILKNDKRKFAQAKLLTTKHIKLLSFQRSLYKQIDWFEVERYSTNKPLWIVVLYSL